MPNVALVLTEHFPILSLTLVTEPLRVANRELTRADWSWTILSAKGGTLKSSSGIDIPTLPLDDTDYDIVILISSYAPENALGTPLLTWLRKKARSGTMMGCVDTGAMIFAEAGLLTKTPAAVHFEALRGYQERYRSQMFVDRMFDISETRCSSAGGVATFDMTLALIAQCNNRALALRVAEILTYRPTEHSGPQQKMLTETSIARLDRTLGRAVDLMLANIRDPLDIDTICTRVDAPKWTLNRLFRKHLKQTPAAYYRYLRLSQAKNMLLNSTYQISEIGSLCGFENPESFSRAYMRLFGRTPTQTRSN